MRQGFQPLAVIGSGARCELPPSQRPKTRLLCFDARVVRNRVFFPEDALPPTETAKNPVSLV